MRLSGGWLGARRVPPWGRDCADGPLAKIKCTALAQAKGRKLHKLSELLWIFYRLLALGIFHEQAKAARNESLEGSIY